MGRLVAACGRHAAGFGAALLAAAQLLPPAAARADAVSVVNALRTEGCADRAAAGAALRRERALDDAAREMAAGRPLEEALDRAGYPAASAASLHVTGTREDGAIRRILAPRHCASVGDSRYAEVGVFARGDETWIVLAARQVEPSYPDPRTIAPRVLALVNAARAEPRRCGGQDAGPAPPLALSDVLVQVAAAHARDMAERGVLDHRGADGSQVAERIARAGYAWQASGENVAAGQRDAERVVAAWLASPGHCATLMTPQFTEMGVAFALAPGKEPPIYWAQVFATPQ